MMICKDSNTIDPTAIIINSSFTNDIKIWKNTFVKNCKLGNSSTIGDFSRIEDSRLDDHVVIQRNNLIFSSQIGRYTYTGKNFTCWHSKIGSFCSISWNVSIGGANHDYKKVTTSAFLYSDIFDIKKDNKGYDRFNNLCEIQDDVWIGCGAVVCRNIKIGTGAVVAANAVVTKDVEPYSIVAGVPAKHIKYRFPPEFVQRLLKIRWWEFPIDLIRDKFDLFNSNLNEDVLQQLMVIREELDNRTFKKSFS